MDYRRDNRTKKQFALDIKKSCQSETEIAVRLCILRYNKDKRWPILLPTGINMDGKVLKKADSTPDFMIDGKFIEVARSDKVCQNKYFHIKTHKVHKAIDEQFDIVFVNGLKEEKEPFFATMTPEILTKLVVLSKEKYGVVKHPGFGNSGIINKPAYRFDMKWLEWLVLPKFRKDIPADYKLIIG